jgi:predicted tellurium resistance membrane protein TerC
MLSLEEDAHLERKPRSYGMALFWIVLMNVVFSFDSILSAMALSDNYYVMATAIIIGGLLMIWMADGVSAFLQKNRMYEVVGLFILFLVGVMLISEGGHIAHLKLFGYPIEPLSKATFYLVIFVMVLVDMVQSRYQKKIMALKKAKADSQLT